MSRTAADATPDPIARYLLAVMREVELSSFWGRYFRIEGSLLDVPNGFAHHALLHRHATSIRAILVLARPMWVFVGLPALALIWAVRWTLASGWEAPRGVPSRVYLHASNDRNMRFVPADAGRPSVAITLPWRGSSLPGSWAESSADLRAISSRRSVWRAALWSVRAALRLWRSSDSRRVLFTYSAPTWFWTYDALRRASLESVWMSNHVDRWASLATSLDGVRATIVQHGDLGHHDAKAGTRLVPHLSRKLEGVERVFVTDAGSIDDFVGAVTGAGPVFTRIDLGMRVVPWVDAAPGARRVLVIGHPDAQTAMGRLIRDVRAQAGTGVVVAYRPHPTEALPVVLPLVASDDVAVTDTGDTVPDVDIVVSYGSSVTAEIIAATGAQLVRWDPNDPESVLATVTAVVRAVTSPRPAAAAAARD